MDTEVVERLTQAIAGYGGMCPEIAEFPCKIRGMGGEGWQDCECWEVAKLAIAALKPGDEFGELTVVEWEYESMACNIEKEQERKEAAKRMRERCAVAMEPYSQEFPAIIRALEIEK